MPLPLVGRDSVGPDVLTIIWMKITADEEKRVVGKEGEGMAASFSWFCCSGFEVDHLPVDAMMRQTLNG
jgi:hypothetical protein